MCKERIMSAMKKLLILIFAMFLVFGHSALASEEIIETNIEDGAVLYELPEKFFADINASSMFFYLDGHFIGKSDDTGAISTPEMSYGKHKLKVIAVMDDGNAAKTEVIFEYLKKQTVLSFSQDFTGASELDGDTIYDFGFSKGKTAGVADFSSTVGRSGEDGDFAMQFDITTNDKVASGYPYVECTSA